MKPQIGISEKNLERLSALLNVVLSNQMILYLKTRKFHSNVHGESFVELRKIFQTQYETLSELAGEVADRITELGSHSVGTMHEFLKGSFLKEHPGKYPSSVDMLKELLADHEAMVVHLRKDVALCSEKYNDAGTAIFLTELMQAHETTAWLLRKYLK